MLRTPYLGEITLRSGALCIGTITSLVCADIECGVNFLPSPPIKLRFVLAADALRKKINEGNSQGGDNPNPAGIGGSDTPIDCTATPEKYVCTEPDPEMCSLPECTSPLDNF